MYNGLSYETLGEALKAVDNSDETEERLVLQRDITIDGIVETGEISKNGTLDLNEFHIGGSKDGSLLCINDRTLTLENETIENESTADTAIAISGNIVVPDSMDILPKTGWQTSKSVTVEKKTYCMSTAIYCNGKVSQIAGAVFPETSVVGYGDNLDLAMTPPSGYRIPSIVVNGRNVGSGSTHVLMDVREDKEIVINFEPDGLRIMLDSGHGDKEINQEGSYKEHERLWLLMNYLELQLEKYGNVFIGMTKSTVGQTPGVVERGTMSAGSDLLISMHSNWSGDSADHPLAIVSSGLGLWSKSYYVGEALATTIRIP